MTESLSRLSCESCGFRPYSPPRWHGEVRRVRSGKGKVRVSFLCEACAGVDAIRPLQGIEAEIALHCWLSEHARGVSLDENARREIRRNTMKALEEEEA